MNTLGTIILCLVVVSVLCAPRRWALMSMVAGVLYLPQGLHLDIFGFNLFALRFVELAGFIRVMSRQELSFSKLNGIDRSLALFSTYTTVVFLFRSPDGQAFEIGRTVDTLLCYFTFRGLLRDVDEFRWFLASFLLLLIPYVVLVLLERVTLANPFNEYLAGTAPFVVREGKIRAAGSFNHPSLLGTLGGSFIPLYVGLWIPKKSRAIASVGIALCVAIVVASNSGAPIACVVVALIGWIFWGMRTRMRLVLYGLMGLLALLAISMKAPIWYLLARFSDLTGGDGYHRSYLMDISFQNLDKWWLGGMAIADTKDWFPYLNYTTGGADMTNQYLVFGMTAGFGAIALFIIVLKRAFNHLGKALDILRSKGRNARDEEYLIWGLGVMVLVHVINWLSIPYFDQSVVLWLMELAIIANLTTTIMSQSPSTISRRNSGACETVVEVHTETPGNKFETGRQLPEGTGVESSTQLRE